MYVLEGTLRYTVGSETRDVRCSLRPRYLWVENPCGAKRCMNAIGFVASNILIYAHDRDASMKRELAVAKLAELWDAGDGRLSVQVLLEFT